MDITPDIKAIRAKLGWTQQRMAQELGVDRASVSRMESGQRISGPVSRLLISLDPAAAPSAGTAAGGDGESLPPAASSLPFAPAHNESPAA